MICCGFLVGKFDGELVNGMRWSIATYFIGVPNKYILQAIDTKQNKFSIKTSKTFSNDNNTLIIDYNGLTCNVDSVKYSDWRSDKSFFLGIGFIFKEYNLYYQYYLDNYMGELSKEQRCLSNIQALSNSNSNKHNIKQIDWPNVKDLYQMSNQTKIWLGYSNKIISSDNNSDWSNISYTEIIIGCVYSYNFNDRAPAFEMKGDNFHTDCSLRVASESICYQYGSCKNVSVYYQTILDCNKYGLFSPEMSTAKHCYRDVPNKNIDVLHSYERISDTNSITVQLEWITQLSKNHCLMDIITRNNLLIELYLNSHNQIILAIKYDKSIIWSKHILYEISSNQIHVLRIEFTESNTTFKVSNEFYIKTLILQQLGSVKLINVGRNFGENICRKPKIKSVFRYDSKKFRLLRQSNVRSWLIFLIVIITVSCLISIGIGWIIVKKTNQKENIPRLT